MAYTPINWQTGDTITAEKMNKMDNGWGIESTTSQLLSETVTTTDQDGMIFGMLIYATQITADSIVVTFNGTDYTVAKQEPLEGMTGYGTFSAQGPLFTTYPFYIYSVDDGTNQLFTETAGSYAVAVSVPSTTAEVSDDFKSAVNATVDAPLLCEIGVTTGAQIMEASNANRLMYFVYDGEYHILLSSYNGDATSGSFSIWYPPASHDFQSVGVSNGVFALNV